MWRRAKTAAVHCLFLLVIPFAAFSAAARLFLSLSQSSPLQDRSGGITCYLTSMNVLGENRYEEIDNWMSECPDIPEADRRGFAVRKVLHEISHDPGAFLLHLVRKNRVLSRADDYLFWAGSTEPEPWDKTSSQVKRINSSRLPEQSMVAYVAHLALILLVGWRLLLFPAVSFRMDEAIPILFSATYYGMFLVLLESQARYEIFLVFLFSWMAGQAAVDLHDRAANRSRKPAPPLAAKRAAVYSGGALCLVAVAGLYWGGASAIADSSLTLRDQSGFEPVPSGEIQGSSGPQIPPVFVANNHKQLMLSYPAGLTLEVGSIMAVQRTFAIRTSGRHHLRFFLSTDAVHTGPYENAIPWNDQKIGYAVLANGFPVARGQVEDIYGSRYVSAEPGPGFQFGRNVTLQLILRNESRISRVGPERSPLIALEYIDLQ